jgi:hypothetical protein
MADCVGTMESSGECLTIGKVSDDRSVPSGYHEIDDEDVVALFREDISHVRTEEAGAASHYEPHVRLT